MSTIGYHTYGQVSNRHLPAELYPLETEEDKIEAGPAESALPQITAAWAVKFTHAYR
ncbi:MAG: hypothetical protein JXM73_08845 [Anaerolineae bacterium]|nr:hypothetical protein [Anaerolineae bacterium]